MDIRTKSQGGEPTYNVAVGRAGRGKRGAFPVTSGVLPYRLLRSLLNVLNKSASP